MIEHDEFASRLVANWLIINSRATLMHQAPLKSNQERETNNIIITTGQTGESK